MKKIAPLFAITAGTLWGCMGLFVRRLNLYNLETMDIVSIRAVITGIIMFLYLLIFDRGSLKIKLKDIWCFLGSGLLSIIFFNFCYFKCITLTSLSVAAILLYTAPVIVMILSIFIFKEKFNKRKLAAVLLTFAGCVLVSGITEDMTELSAAGIITGLGAGLGYALYSIFGRFALNRGYSSTTITFYTFLIAGLGSVFMTDSRRVIGTMFSNIEIFVLCIVFCIVATVIPYMTYTIGLKYIENSRASVLAAVEPVVASIVGLAILGESISVTMIFGICMVIFSLVLLK